VQEGELLAAKSDFPTAFARFWEAQSLDPPPDTPIHVWIPEGWFVMGSNRDDKEAYPDQMPQQKVWVDDYWIQRTEVTNRQYRRCVEAKTCVAPHNEYWDKQQYAYLPVTHVDWFQADAYARWVGGRLPTEAEWEKACRGDDGRIFAWGNGLPSPSITSFSGSGLPLPSIIGSYSAGTHGLYDMSGNVWEWTSSLDWPYPYTADDGRENQADVGPRILRGGAFNHEGNTDFGVSCTVRGRGGPFGLGGYYGFRVAVPSGQ
jgi:formylglycine-generating enzyme required for sulfatase activity